MKTIQVEFMLLAWADETSKSGPKIVFALPDSAALEPFKAMTLAKGKIVGQRLVGHLVELDEQELPKDLPAPGKGGPLSILAARWCQDQEFQQWLFSTFEMAATNMPREEAAADIVRSVCHVSSRAELDHNSVAAHNFDWAIRKPYMQHLQSGARYRE
jgi:hypothetical protein